MDLEVMQPRVPLLPWERLGHCPIPLKAWLLKVSVRDRRQGCSRCKFIGPASFISVVKVTPLKVGCTIIKLDRVKLFGRGSTCEKQTFEAPFDTAWEFAIDGAIQPAPKGKNQAKDTVRISISAQIKLWLPHKSGKDKTHGAAVNERSSYPTVALAFARNGYIFSFEW